MRGYVPKMQASNEELLKPREFLNHVPTEDAKRESNFYILCGSLITLHS